MTITNHRLRNSAPISNDEDELERTIQHLISHRYKNLKNLPNVSYSIKIEILNRIKELLDKLLIEKSGYLDGLTAEENTLQEIINRQQQAFKKSEISRGRHSPKVSLQARGPKPLSRAIQKGKEIEQATPKFSKKSDLPKELAIITQKIAFVQSKIKEAEKQMDGVKKEKKCLEAEETPKVLSHFIPQNASVACVKKVRPPALNLQGLTVEAKQSQSVPEKECQPIAISQGSPTTENGASLEQLKQRHEAQILSLGRAVLRTRKAIKNIMEIDNSLQPSQDVVQRWNKQRIQELIEYAAIIAKAKKLADELEGNKNQEK